MEVKVCASFENNLLSAVASVLGIWENIVGEIIHSMYNCLLFLSICIRHVATE